MTQETPQVCLLWWLFFLSIQITLMRHSASALQLQVAYILLSSCWGSHLKGHRKRDEMVRVQPFLFQPNLPCADVQYILLTECKQFLNASVSVHKSPSAFSVWAQGGIVRSECGRPEGGRRGWGSSVMAISPLFWNNGWGLQLSLSRIALDSLIPLMHCATRHVGVYMGGKSLQAF